MVFHGRETGMSDRMILHCQFIVIDFMELMGRREIGKSIRNEFLHLLSAYVVRYDAPHYIDYSIPEGTLPAPLLENSANQGTTTPLSLGHGLMDPNNLLQPTVPAHDNKPTFSSVGKESQTRDDFMELMGRREIGKSIGNEFYTYSKYMWFVVMLTVVLLKELFPLRSSNILQIKEPQLHCRLVMD